jgi:ABC-type maltose transport system permease subunit
VEQRCSGAALGALPLIVAFLPFQRQIAEGIAATGIK